MEFHLFKNIVALVSNQQTSTSASLFVVIALVSLVAWKTWMTLTLMTSGDLDESKEKYYRYLGYADVTISASPLLGIMGTLAALVYAMFAALFGDAGTVDLNAVIAANFATAALTTLAALPSCIFNSILKGVDHYYYGN